MQARTIVDVIAALDDIIADAIMRHNRIGYFTALYRRVTLQVKEGIEKGWFQDSARMERLDVVFANRFLDAWEQAQRGQRPTESWLVAIDALSDTSLLVLQHLLLGMNAHINLDLGIAAAEVAPGSSLGALRPDFMKINDILARLITGVEKDLYKLSPMLRTVVNITPTDETKIFNFSLDVARAAAWKFAEELASLDAGARAGAIAARDVKVAQFGGEIRDPSILLGSAIQVVRVAESNDVPQIIGTLNSEAAYGDAPEPNAPAAKSDGWETVTLKRSHPPAPPAQGEQWETVTLTRSRPPRPPK